MYPSPPTRESTHSFPWLVDPRLPWGQIPPAASLPAQDQHPWGPYDSTGMWYGTTDVWDDAEAQSPPPLYQSQPQPVDEIGNLIAQLCPPRTPEVPQTREILWQLYQINLKTVTMSSEDQVYPGVVTQRLISMFFAGNVPNARAFINKHNTFPNHTHFPSHEDPQLCIPKDICLALFELLAADVKATKLLNKMRNFTTAEQVHASQEIKSLIELQQRPVGSPPYHFANIASNRLTHNLNSHPLLFIDTKDPAGAEIVNILMNNTPLHSTGWQLLNPAPNSSSPFSISIEAAPANKTKNLTPTSILSSPKPIQSYIEDKINESTKLLNDQSTTLSRNLARLHRRINAKKPRPLKPEDIKAINDLFINTFTTLVQAVTLAQFHSEQGRSQKDIKKVCKNRQSKATLLANSQDQQTLETVLLEIDNLAKTTDPKYQMLGCAVQEVLNNIAAIAHSSINLLDTTPQTSATVSSKINNLGHIIRASFPQPAPLQPAKRVSFSDFPPPNEPKTPPKTKEGEPSMYTSETPLYASATPEIQKLLTQLKSATDSRYRHDIITQLVGVNARTVVPTCAPRAIWSLSNPQEVQNQFCVTNGDVVEALINSRADFDCKTENLRQFMLGTKDPRLFCRDQEHIPQLKELLTAISQDIQAKMQPYRAIAAILNQSREDFSKTAIDIIKELSASRIDLRYVEKYLESHFAKLDKKPREEPNIEKHYRNHFEQAKRVGDHQKVTEHFNTLRGYQILTHVVQSLKQSKEAQQISSRPVAAVRAAHPQPEGEPSVRISPPPTVIHYSPAQPTIVQAIPASQPLKTLQSSTALTTSEQGLLISRLNRVEKELAEIKANTPMVTPSATPHASPPQATPVSQTVQLRIRHPEEATNNPNVSRATEYVSYRTEGSQEDEITRRIEQQKANIINLQDARERIQKETLAIRESVALLHEPPHPSTFPDPTPLGSLQENPRVPSPSLILSHPPSQINDQPVQKTTFAATDGGLFGGYSRSNFQPVGRPHHDSRAEARPPMHYEPAAEFRPFRGHSSEVLYQQTEHGQHDLRPVVPPAEFRPFRGHSSEVLYQQTEHGQHDLRPVVPAAESRPFRGHSSEVLYQQTEHGQHDLRPVVPAAESRPFRGHSSEVLYQQAEHSRHDLRPVAFPPLNEREETISRILTPIDGVWHAADRAPTPTTLVQQRQGDAFIPWS